MIELRSAPRINVTWRGAVRLNDGRLMMVRVINISRDGILIECNESLNPNKLYPMLLEIPAINGSKDIHKVQCMGLVRHTILSADNYRIGLQLQEISGLHEELVQAWVSLTNRGSG